MKSKYTNNICVTYFTDVMEILNGQKRVSFVDYVEIMRLYSKNAIANRHLKRINSFWCAYA